MESKNICEVDLLDNVSDSTNAIVEENGKLRKTNMRSAIDSALRSAKESGEFKGDKGDTGATGPQGIGIASIAIEEV